MHNLYTSYAILYAQITMSVIKFEKFTFRMINPCEEQYFNFGHFCRFRMMEIIQPFTVCTIYTWNCFIQIINYYAFLIFKANLREII